VLIAKDAVASIHYTLKNDEGEILDTSDGREPLPYVHGKGNLIRGLEAELEGKGAGAKLKVRIEPEDAYGVRDESLVQSVKRSQLPQGDLEVGMQFRAEGRRGALLVTVIEVDGDDVTLDANHPLAGVALNFSVEVMDVRAATPEELSHGHVHGPGGHHH
jgi:FKBP-type peptidyl-prolyl cis-trans isomerase SlyD